MQTLPEFIEKHKVKMSSEYLDERPDNLMSDMPSGSTHWKCILKMGKKRMTVYFSQGPAHTAEPKIEDVLSCVSSDASVHFSCRDALDLMDEFGYTDTRKAREVYNACERQYEKARKFFGKNILDELIYETEGW